MANSLAALGNGNCLEAFPNGTNGEVITMVNGSPTWQSSSSGVSTDANNILTNGTDGKAYLTCEEVQDCVGQAVANGTGLTYDDALNAISATGVPITSGSGLPTPGTLNTPVIYTDTDTDNVYYRDPAGVVLRLNTIFSVTSGPDATTVTSGPIDVDNGDRLHFWGNTIDFAVTPGSVRVQTEVALSADSRNALTTGTDNKLYSSDERTSFGTVAGNAPAAPVSPSVSPTGPTAGDQYIETYSDKIIFWEYSAGTWVLKTSLSLSGEITTFGTVASAAPASPASPASAPAGPTAGNQYIETYTDKILFWEYAGGTWVLRTQVSLTTGEKTTFGTVASAAPAAPVSPSVAPTSPIAGDQYVETYTDTIIFWEYSAGAWALRTKIKITSAFACTDLNTCSINALSDVDTTTTAPATGDYMKWDGTNWVPAASAAGEKTTFGSVASNAPAAPAAPAVSPTSPTAGDQYVESYQDKILIWEYAGGAWGLKVTIPIVAGTNIYNADGTLTANRTVTMDSKSLTWKNTTAIDTGHTFQNPNGTGYTRIDPTGDFEVGTSTAGSKVQLQANGLTIAQVLPAGILEIDGDGSADQSGLQFKHFNDASPVTNGAAHLGVDATGNVVIAPDALTEICDETAVTFDATQRLRIPQESAAGCKVVAVTAPNCATATPAALALGYNGTDLGFYAMREKLPVRTVTANATLNALTDGVIVVNAAAGNVTITLPTPAAGNCSPNHYYIKRTDTSNNTVTIAAAATIDGVASIGLCNANALAKGNLLHVLWSGSVWYSI